MRCYLEVLVDGGASSSWVGVHLSAIRTAFDKMCGRSVNLGLETPRRPKRLPIVLSAQEVVRLLEALLRYATNCFWDCENNTDIRRIQKLLGHAKLETTTIYTKVAAKSTEALQSPLDVLAQVRRDTRPKSVGRLRAELTLSSDDSQGTPSADVVLHILTEPRAIRLFGIVVREPRPGWVTLKVPPLEEWKEPLKWLTREERERVESPDFYRTLQEHLTQKYLSVCRRR